MTGFTARELVPPEGRDQGAWPLLTLLVGPIDSGKTSFLRRWYQTWQWGDGVLSAKRFVGSRVIGYDLERLSTGEICPWARVTGEEPNGWQTWLAVGPFRMRREGFCFVEKAVDAVLAARQGPMILDEVGPLELEGEGFAPLLQRLLAGHQPTLAVIREFCLSEFLDRFPTESSRIVRLQNAC
ncbi:MAG TPA: nucleoside-triphosphatase [Candidatus Ozemobacteraceae bacterium]|nr:nucleoside-triphosphatase [Candidatus Ozemobacteraceae bacterium]